MPEILADSPDASLMTTKPESSTTMPKVILSAPVTLGSLSNLIMPPVENERFDVGGLDDGSQTQFLHDTTLPTGKNGPGSLCRPRGDTNQPERRKPPVRRSVR